MKEDEILKNQKVLAFLPWIQASRQTFLYLFIFWFLKIILVTRKSYFFVLM